MSQVPPHDLAAERAVLGCCLLSTDATTAAISTVTSADFYNPRHQQTFDAITVLHLADEHVDHVSVASALGASFDESPMTWLHELTLETPAVSAVRRYATTVLEHAKSRSLIHIGAELADAGYNGQPAQAVANRIAEQLADSELLRRHEVGNLRGFYHDIGELDPGVDRDDSQPWIAHGFLRRGQRALVVAKAGIGKSTFLRQLAFCAEAGVHPLTGQVTEKPRRALIVELEAGQWDITASTRDILLGLRRAMQLRSAEDIPRPSLLHRPGGLDIRTPSGRAALEAAIQREQPELVVMGPVKYMGSIKPGENYETAALGLHALLNDLLSRYQFALAMEAHFSRGDHGVPGGSERWVDWPDVGFTIHPHEADQDRPLVPTPSGTEMIVRQFRISRDSDIWLPRTLIRGAKNRLPWSVDDQPDPIRSGTSMFVQRYGGNPGDHHTLLDDF